ncbi:hypothetical protein DMUE_5714, partial [Dictyocoela muelleri]
MDNIQKNKNTTNTQRQDLIKKVLEDGYNIKEAALLSNIEFFTAAKIIKAYKLEGRIDKNKTGKQSNKKITPEIINFIEKNIEEFPLITLEEIKSKILVINHISISIETIR